MLWAGTPGAGLGPRHIDWGPGGCARRSLLFGHSLNVGRAAVSTATAVAATSRRRSSSPSKRRGTPDYLNRRILLSNFQWFLSLRKNSLTANRPPDLFHAIWFPRFSGEHSNIWFCHVTSCVLWLPFSVSGVIINKNNIV